MTTIVSAIIAILVLLTVIAIFSSNMKTPATKLKEESGKIGDNIPLIAGCDASNPCPATHECDTRGVCVLPVN